MVGSDCAVWFFRFACLFCCKLDSEYEPNACSLKPLSYRVFDEFISRALSKMPVKVNFGLIDSVCFFIHKYLHNVYKSLFGRVE